MLKKNTLPLVLFICIFLTTPTLVTAQAAAEVEQVARQVLDAISQRDTTLFRSLFVPQAQVAVVGEREGKRVYFTRGVDDDVQMLGGDGPAFLERMWEPEVRVDGQLASVWTRYDFYIDGKFSHCGTDAFHLVHTEDGWKVVALMYNAESDMAKCPESPLGKP